MGMFCLQQLSYSSHRRYSNSMLTCMFLENHLKGHCQTTHCSSSIKTCGQHKLTGEVLQGGGKVELNTHGG